MNNIDTFDGFKGLINISNIDQKNKTLITRFYCK